MSIELHCIVANLQRRPLKLGRLIVLQKTPTPIKHFVPMASHSFPVPTHLISICTCKWFSARPKLNKATKSSLHIYINGGSCIRGSISKYENGTLKMARNVFNIGEVWNPVCCHGNKTVKFKLWSTFFLLQT